MGGDSERVPAWHTKYAQDKQRPGGTQAEMGVGAAGEGGRYLRFSPPSEHWKFRPAGCELTNDFRWDSSKARHMSSSEELLKGSRFIRRVPENRMGSWEHNRVLEGGGLDPTRSEQE